MGTDIHLYVERQNASGQWEALPPPERDLTKWPRTPRVDDGWISPWWGPEECMVEGACYHCTEDREPYDSIAPGPGCEHCLGTGREVRWYDNRNYDVFAILADVHNGYAFAGCDTSDGFRVIAQPRGMPEDVSAFVRDHHSWDHTPSWLSLGEILAFDYTRTTIHRGVIPLREDTDPSEAPHRQDNFTDWDARGGGVPKSYSGWISGKGIVIVKPAIAKRILNDPKYKLDNRDTLDHEDRVRFGDGRLVKEPRVFVQVSWSETYAQSASDFLAFVEHFLKPLGDPERIRIVFGFDS